MKVAVVLPSLANTGPVIVAHNIVRGLVENSIPTDVYYLTDIKGLDFPCPTHKITISTPIDFDSYDIIHSHGLRPDLYTRLWRGRIHQAKTVSTIHQDIYQDLRYHYGQLKAQIFTPLWIRALKGMDCTVPISGFLRRVYENRLGNLSETVYNGVNVDYNPTLCSPQIVSDIKRLKERNLKILAGFANFEMKRKGFDMIFKLLERRADLAFVIIGGGKNTEAIRAEYPEALKRTLFVPFQKSPYNYLEYCDVYVMPSRSEGFGLALIEATATHTSVVCSDIAIFREILTDEEACFFELENIDSLSDAIDLALTDSPNRAEKAYEKYKRCYTDKIMALNYINLYTQLIKKWK